MRFVPSIELSRTLYESRIAPIMGDKYPEVKYAAATFGMCSECLGLDDEVSMDHMWGPRVTIVLSEEDQQQHGEQITKTLLSSLPERFEGFSMSWRIPEQYIQDTTEKPLYSVSTTALSSILWFCGGPSALPLKSIDWLRISEQHLLEYTNGVIYRDDTGEFTRTRAQLGYYPDDVLRYLLARTWGSVGGHWFPIGRIGVHGDILGLHIQAAKVAQSLMRIGFMVSRKYFAYPKWFGTLFNTLPVGKELQPVLHDLLVEERWQRVEELIWDAASILLRCQNGLGIAPEVSTEVRASASPRHHVQCDFEEIARRTFGTLTPDLKELEDRQLDWFYDKQFILWNGETAKWSLFLVADK